MNKYFTIYAGAGSGSSAGIRLPGHKIVHYFALQAISTDYLVPVMPQSSMVYPPQIQFDLKDIISHSRDGAIESLTLPDQHDYIFEIRRSLNAIQVDG